MYTLDTLIDQAVDQSPIFRRLAYKWILRNNGIRSAFAATLVDKMSDEPSCQPIVTASLTVNFTSNTELALDPDNLKTILDFILKILPLLLQLFVR